MNPYTLAAIILTLAVAISYLNHRFIRLQNGIAIMVGSILLSFTFIIVQRLGITNLATRTENLLIQTDFHNLLIHGMLSFLLFAGALNINFSALKSRKLEIGILSSFSTIASAILVGVSVYYIFPLLGIQIPFLYAFLFGALISPTDPISVLATLKEIKAPKSLEVCMAGESLFNDGVGILIFLTLYQLIFNNISITFWKITLLFIEQAGGGIFYGLILGLVSTWLIKAVKDTKTVILITIALVTGGYNFALWIHISGPLAMVVAGILLANKVRIEIKLFWEFIDEILNAILFLLIGFELLALHISRHELLLMLCVIPLVLIVRLITVAIPIKSIQFKRKPDPYAISILTWGGLRGGLAVALAMTVPSSHCRDFIIAMTYVVVAFAIIVQGFTIKPLAKLAREVE